MIFQLFANKKEFFLDDGMPKFVCFFGCVTAEADSRDQGFPSHGEEEGREVCEDQEEQGCGQVQGPLLKVPLHIVRARFREGRQAEAIASSRLFTCTLYFNFVVLLI